MIGGLIMSILLLRTVYSTLARHLMIKMDFKLLQNFLILSAVQGSHYTHTLHKHGDGYSTQPSSQYMKSINIFTSFGGKKLLKQTEEYTLELVVSVRVIEDLAATQLSQLSSLPL